MISRHFSVLAASLVALALPMACKSEPRRNPVMDELARAADERAEGLRREAAYYLLSNARSPGPHLYRDSVPATSEYMFRAYVIADTATPIGIGIECSDKFGVAASAFLPPGVRQSPEPVLRLKSPGAPTTPAWGDGASRRLMMDSAGVEHLRRAPSAILHYVGLDGTGDSVRLDLSLFGELSAADWRRCHWP